MKYHLVEATWKTGGMTDMVHCKKAVYESETIEEATDKAREEFGAVTLDIRPIHSHRFEVGDRVTMVNDYGISWPGKTITGLLPPNVAGEPCYSFTPDDTPWFPHSERNLYREGDA